MWHMSHECHLTTRIEGSPWSRRDKHGQSRMEWEQRRSRENERKQESPDGCCQTIPNRMYMVSAEGIPLHFCSSAQV